MAETSVGFTLKFGNEENEINALTYAAILTNTVTVIEEANKETDRPIPLDIVVKSERAGSFEVDLQVQAAAALTVLSPMLTAENLKTAHQTVKEVVEYFTQAFDLVKKFKGEKPKSVEPTGNNQSIVITGDNNRVIVSDAVARLTLENKKAQNAIAGTFAALSKDESVESFQIIDIQDEVRFLAEKQEFPRLSRRIEVSAPETRTSVQLANLYITRQSFERDKRSDFILGGFPISAMIEDEGFWRNVDDGEAFAKGDILFANLEIEQKFNRTINTYENKSYTIRRVINHIPRSSQIGLFEPEAFIEG